MALRITEDIESRWIIRNAQRPTEERTYSVVADAGEDRDAVANGVADFSPTSVDPWGSGLVFIPRYSIEVRPLSDTLFKSIVRYEVVGGPGGVDEEFETGGATAKITQAFEHVESYAPPGKTPPDHKGAINVTADGVEGVDFPVPSYRWSETHWLPALSVTTAYRILLRNSVGMGNNAAFRGFAAYEVRFLGVRGSKRRGENDWQLTFAFESEPNAPDFFVGDIEHIDKPGVAYIWFEYAQVEDAAAKRLAAKPIAAHVEALANNMDFAAFGIGTLPLP